MTNKINYNCSYFKGFIPCIPNKLRNRVCDDCDEYLPISKRILIIKLGAIGDVIRSTALLVKYRNLYPICHITWVTHTPDILPLDMINTIYRFEFTSIFNILHQDYDIAINLDKEPEACGLLSDVNAIDKYGFIWKDGHLSLATKAAEHKLMTGLFDNISKLNTKNYLEEIFDICHLKFEGEPYILNYSEEYFINWSKLRVNAGTKKIIGLNTGCGKRWQTRLWPNENWLRLIDNLLKTGYYPVLLGGKDEDENNKLLADKSGAYYPGYFSLEEFIALSNHCDLVVTQVSMMMHIAIGLKKPLVLMNNIFNRYEFELYGNGIIVEPTTGCDCYYGTKCTRDKSCMLDISVEIIFTEICKIL